MKSIATLICLFSFSLNGISQFKFQDEAIWKYAFEMIYQAKLGNCKMAYEMFDSLQQNEFNVNKRRMKAGLEPIEIYAKVLGVKDYDIPMRKE